MAGIDNDEDMLNLADVAAHLNGLKISLYCQDALTPWLIPSPDAVVSDLPIGYYPIDENAKNFATKANKGHSFAHLLFIEQIIKNLKPAGYAFLVVPKSILAGKVGSDFMPWLSKKVFLRSIYAQALFEIAWVGIIRQYQHFLYFYAAWAVGLVIWYFVTIKSKPIKKAEIIVKIIFFFVIALNAIYAALLGDSNATFLAVLLMICYAVGCPWGKLGYKKHPYNESTSEPTDSQHSSSLPWYKTWWTWLVIVATIIFVSGAFIIMTDGSFRNSDNSTDPFEESHKSAANTINVDYKKYKIDQRHQNECSS